MKALNPMAAFWYTPRGEEGAERPTRFKIRGLDGTQQGYVYPELKIDGKMVIGMTGKGLELTLEYGLVDWENFANDQGPVPFTRQNLGMIDYAVRAELAMQIIAAGHVKPEEKKT